MYPLVGPTTTSEFIGLVRGLLNEQDNQRIQDLSMRMYINGAKEELHSKVLATTTPLYEYVFHSDATGPQFDGTIEGTQAFSYNALNSGAYVNYNNLFQIRKIDLGLTTPYNLRTAAGGLKADTLFHGRNTVRPLDHISNIKAVSLLGYGTGKEIPYAELMTIAHSHTQIWEHSFLWAMSGTDILIYNGPYTRDIPQPNTLLEVFEVLAVRKPLADDLLFPQMSYGYNNSIDVPAEHHKTLALMVQRACLEALGKTVMPQIDQAVDATAQGKVQTTITNKEIGAI